jgi:hypothetical protein
MEKEEEDAKGERDEAREKIKDLEAQVRQRLLSSRILHCSSFSRFVNRSRNAWISSARFCRSASSSEVRDATQEGQARSSELKDQVERLEKELEEAKR